MKHIIILALCGIGDWIVALPAVLALRRTYPGVRLTVVSDKPWADVGRLAGLQAMYGKATGWPWYALWQQGAVVVDRDSLAADLVIDVGGSVRRAAHIAGTLGCPVISLPVELGPSCPGILAERITRALADALSVDLTYADLTLDGWSGAAEAGRDLAERVANGRRLLVVHPGASAPERTLPEPTFWAAVQEVQEATGFRTLVVLGAREVGRGQTAVPDWVADKVVEPSIHDFAGIVAEAAAYVGHCTGPTHVAAWTLGPDGRRTPVVMVNAHKSGIGWEIERPWVTTVQALERPPRPGLPHEIAMATLKAAVSRPSEV